MNRRLRVRGRHLVAMFAGVGILVAAAVSSSLTDTVDITTASISEEQRAVTANDIKPTHCGSITVTTIVQGSGTLNGTNDAELIFGSPTLDVISGSGGDDCILGGAAADNIDGGPGTDVCIGNDDTVFSIECESTIRE